MDVIYTLIANSDLMIGESLQHGTEGKQTEWLMLVPYPLFRRLAVQKNIQL